MNKIKIGFDIDGVIADFVGGFFKWFGKDMPKIVTWENEYINQNFHKIAHNKEFWLSLPKAIEPEQFEGIDVTCYITARPVDPHISWLWLVSNGFPNAPVFGVGSNGAIHDPKVTIVKDVGLNFFVDDKKQHFDEINSQTDCTCFLWNTTWTEWEDAQPKLYNIQKLKQWL